MANQTGIVGNPYSGGNVVFNQTPFTQFYLNSLARQQAQKDAFAKSMQEQAKSLTPSGMRGNDVQALMQAKNDWQTHWMQNKDAIMHPDRDNGKAWSENNDLYNKAAATTSQSKELAKTDQALLKLQLDPNRASRLAPNAIKRIELHQLPINDPQHKPLMAGELESDMFNPKPLTPQADEALSKLVTTRFPGEEDVTKTKIGELNPDFTRSKTVVHNPTKEELNGLLALGEQFHNDGTLTGEVNKLINDHAKLGSGMHNPVYDHYNDIIKNYYGHDINIEHPEELATAMLIDRNASYKPHEGKPIADFTAKKAYEDALWTKHNKITSSQADERQLRSQQHQDQTNYNPQSHVDAIYASGKPDNTIYQIGGKQVTGRQVSLPDEVENKLFDKYKGNPIRPDKTVMDDNKQNVHLIFFNGKTSSGNDIIDKERTRTIPISSSLVPTLEKTFGNPKKNLYTAPTAVTSTKNKPTTGRIR